MRDWRQKVLDVAEGQFLRYKRTEFLCYLKKERKKKDTTDLAGAGKEGGQCPPAAGPGARCMEPPNGGV